MGVQPENYAQYLEEIAKEAARARVLYDLLVVPGLQLTYNDHRPETGGTCRGHRTSKDFVSVDDGIDDALRMARDHGAAIVAAHPYADEPSPIASRLTQRWAYESELRALAHRFEALQSEPSCSAGSRTADSPAWPPATSIALEHLHGWKTLLPCTKDEAAVIDYLRSPRPVYLARVDRMSLQMAA